MSLEKEADLGVIRKAMAFRVKYRIVEHGQAKRRINIGAMGVHPKNRGGIYPNEDRVKQLCVSILQVGCDEADANHNGVVLQEIPADEAPKGYQTILQFNEAQTSCKPDLKSCFNESKSIEFGTLSHSHLILVLRCWLTKAIWGITKDDVLFDFINKSEQLDLSAVAEKDPCFAKVANEGLWMEVLSYKMVLEEPTAASLISNALNKGQEAALRTSELTAVAVLTGAVTMQMEGCLSREVDYATIKDKLRNELDTYVDEPEFIELFQTVVDLGANTASFLPELLEFGSKFVNSKIRQLRLNAFTAINKIPTEFPRTKVAVLKRAYRKNPAYGYCPSPESGWSKVAPGTTLLNYGSAAPPPRLPKTTWPHGGPVARGVMGGRGSLRTHPARGSQEDLINQLVK